MTAGRPQAFLAFVARAGEGRNSLPRILLSVLLVTIVLLGAVVGIIAAGAFLTATGWLPQRWVPAPVGDDFVGSFIGSRGGVVALFLAIAAFWPGVWLAVRLIHRRPFAGVLGWQGRIARGDFWRGLAAACIAVGLTSLAAILFDPTVARSEIPITAWLAALPVFAVVVLVQSSGEELFFRGYLMQSLGHRFGSPFVFAVLPALFFAVLHVAPEAGLMMNLLVIGSILVFAGVAAVIVWKTGNLGAAMGLHFGNNLFALLVVSATDAAMSPALFNGRPIEDAGWSSAEGASLAIGQVLMCAVMLFLLLHRRSPLRLRLDRPAGSGE